MNGQILFFPPFFFVGRIHCFHLFNSLGIISCDYLSINQSYILLYISYIRRHIHTSIHYITYKPKKKREKKKNKKEGGGEKKEKREKRGGQDSRDSYTSHNNK